MSPSFRWHNATQFLGALNDNVFQGLMIFFLIGLLGETKKADINAVAAIIFVIPFLLFTPFAGTLADRFSKSRIIVLAKAAELVIMILGCLIFYFNFAMGIYVMLFLMCTQSAFFGPCKYGIIPELIEKDQISRANSFLESMTYLSIVLGAAMGPLLTDFTGRQFGLAGLACVGISVIGLLTSTRIRKTQPIGEYTAASLFFFKDVVNTLRQVRQDRELRLTIWASADFMRIGGFAKINLIPFGMESCGYNDTHSGLLFVIAAVGIGLGSWMAGKLSGRNVELGIVPLGAIGMAVMSIGLGLTGTVSVDAPISIFMFPRWGIFTLILLMGISCGLYIVPIHSFIQFKAPSHIRGRVLAASGFLGWIGVFLAAMLVKIVCGNLGVPSRWMFLILGLLTLGLAVGTVILLPDFLVRLIVVMITRLIYRIRVEGEENIPLEGPAMIISNHVSWADAVVLGATQQRRIRFIMDRQFYEIPWLNWLFRLQKVIPISASDPPKKIVAALHEARQALDDGYLVCIFAEGMLTRTGQIGRFHAGFEKIVKGTTYPIIPTYLGGLWGSILSHYHGKVMSAWPKRLPCPVSVHFGKALPSDASRRDIRWAIEELSVDYFNQRKSTRHSLGETFIQSARRNWRKPFVSDTTGKRLSFGQALIAATAMAGLLEKQTAGQKNIGVFLPSSVAGALANLAIAILDKASVNLSYTASDADPDYMFKTADIHTVLTSRAFLEKLNIEESKIPGAVFGEDLNQPHPPAAKPRAALRAIFWPRKKLSRTSGAFISDRTAAVLFSSGSSGRPKGIELTHHNIQSNLEAALMVFRALPNDKLCGILPFFHSFGLTCTLWLPIIAGVPVCYVPNPLDGKLVGQTLLGEKATLLFATPTFLLNYYRRCEKEDFATVRFIIAGAEKFKIKLMDAFEEKFGVRPREGYGTTECSPLIALNVLDVEIGGITQIGTRDGTVGHTLPGMAVRVLHPETGEPVEPGQPGLLFVKGPSVMKGYLQLPEKTAEVLHDGWYNTGDIVSVDEDGFVTIHDRLSRFSKIGGEMVPHTKVEEAVQTGLQTQEQMVAVTGIPEEKKGEKLVMLYVKDKVDPDRLHEILSRSDLPNLYIPKRENLLPVEEIPRLGSGKIDIMRIRQMALEILKVTGESFAQEG
jgi:acyl-[acyl-carrier-protein]-phospholipid O-acyltransferase/long-chain-fatty-acid--[acyl-carrier-protein] ligase